MMHTCVRSGRQECTVSVNIALRVSAVNLRFSTTKPQLFLNPKAKGAFWGAKLEACCCASVKKRQLQCKRTNLSSKKNRKTSI